MFCRLQLSNIGVAKINGLPKPRLSPLAHAAAGAALLRTDEIALLCRVALHPFAQRLASVAFFRRRQLSNIGVAKINGLSNPRLSPLAHAAAGAALLRTGVIALLCRVALHQFAQRLARVACFADVSFQKLASQKPTGSPTLGLHPSRNRPPAPRCFGPTRLRCSAASPCTHLRNGSRAWRVSPTSAFKSWRRKNKRALLPSALAPRARGRRRHAASDRRDCAALAALPYTQLRNGSRA